MVDVYVWYRRRNSFDHPLLLYFGEISAGVYTGEEFRLEVMRISAQVGDMFLVEFWPDWVPSNIFDDDIALKLMEAEEVDGFPA